VRGAQGESLRVTLYARDGCHLCDDARAELAALAETIPLVIEEVDIAADPALERALFDRIPVIEVGGARLQAPIEPPALRRAVHSAAFRARNAEEKTVQSTHPSPPGDVPPAVTGRRRNAVIAFDRFFLGFSRHWVAVLSVVVSLYAGIPFAAPVAMHNGWTGLANAIYTVYSPVCHQFSFRSWFLFGEQTVYPRARADVPGVLSFEEAASREPFFQGINVNTLDANLSLAAKAFRGSERMGWKVAFCQRDVAIYVAIAVFGVVFAVLRRLGLKVPYLPFWAYLIIAVAPMGMDGFSQLFANPPFNGFGLGLYPIRESTPFLRALTGGLFGMGNAWLAYPYIEDSMRETREMLETKLIRAGVLKTAARPSATLAD
jgi:uncharacterized membrane protein